MEQDRASALLGVDGVQVVDVEVEDGGRLSVWVATDDPAAAVCPGCSVPAGRVHERLTSKSHLSVGPAGHGWVNTCPSAISVSGWLVRHLLTT